MVLEQVLHRDLGCASYLIADGGEAVVVDPRWDVDVYLELAARAGARITHVVDTHHHADHVSGRGRLAAACAGARLHAPEGGLRDGDEIRIGQVTLRVLATPGHRPEHISLVIEDRSRSAEPAAVLAGDSLFIGDVARPDLAVEAREGARDVRRSLDRLLALGDHVALLPGHVAGSLCGGGTLSDADRSTIGYERQANPFLELAADPFVDWLAGRAQPAPPNLDRVVALNRGSLAEEPPSPVVVEPADVRELLAAGAAVLDMRAPDVFDVGHLVGAINLGAASGGVGTRAGQVVDADATLLVVADSIVAATATVALLRAGGLWGTAYVTTVDPDAWRATGAPVVASSAMTPAEAAGHLASGARLVDVREAEELAAGTPVDALHIPLGRLREQIPAEGAYVVACARGGRAAIAASVLRRHGLRDVTRMRGNVAHLAAHGVHLETRA